LGRLSFFLVWLLWFSRQRLERRARKPTRLLRRGEVVVRKTKKSAAIHSHGRTPRRSRAHRRRPLLRTHSVTTASSGTFPTAHWLSQWRRSTIVSARPTGFQAITHRCLRWWRTAGSPMGLHGFVAMSVRVLFATIRTAKAFPKTPVLRAYLLLISCGSFPISRQVPEKACTRDKK